jgi:hypothetical protein
MFLGEQLPHQPRNFILACSFEFYDGRDICQMQLTNIVPNLTSNVPFMLDLNYFLEKSRSISVSDALEGVDTAHLKLN